MTNRFIIEGIAPIPFDARGHRVRAHRCSPGFSREHAEEAAQMAFGPGFVTRVVETDEKTLPAPRILAEQDFDAEVVQMGWT